MTREKQVTVGEKELQRIWEHEKEMEREIWILRGNCDYFRKEIRWLEDRIINHISEEELHKYFDVTILTSTTPQVQIKLKQ